MKGKRRRSSLELISHGLAVCCGADGLAAARDWFWQRAVEEGCVAAWAALPCGLDIFIIDVKSSFEVKVKVKMLTLQSSSHCQCKRRSAVTRSPLRSLIRG